MVSAYRNNFSSVYLPLKIFVLKTMCNHSLSAVFPPFILHSYLKKIAVEDHPPLDSFVETSCLQGQLNPPKTKQRLNSGATRGYRGMDSVCSSILVGTVYGYILKTSFCPPLTIFRQNL